MDGTIYLGGGGSAADEAELWRAMLPTRRRLLFWPFALAPERHAAAVVWLSESLRELDLAAEVETWTDLAAHRPEELAAFDLLFVGGGNTFTLLEQVQRHGFLDPVREFVAAGGDYYGGSAGAILACHDIRIAGLLDPNDSGLTDLRALGLLDGVTVLPHYTPGQAARALDWSRRFGVAVIGIPERGGLVVRAGEVTPVGGPVDYFPA